MLPYSKKLWRGKNFGEFGEISKFAKFFSPIYIARAATYSYMVRINSPILCAKCHRLYMEMSVLQYFKKQQKPTSSLSEDNLPDPKGPLSEKIPSKAILTANEKVTEVLKQGEKSVRGPYHTLTPAQKLTVGKRATEFGTTAAMRFFAKKYPQLPLKETTVRRLKNIYQSQLKQQRGDTSSSEDLQDFLLKRQAGR